jgi:DNA-binding FadR family transcriptional regulator
MNRTRSEADYVRVRDYVLDLLNEDKLPQGRLPTERALSEQLAVGRGVTRRVLGEFEAKGLIFRHVGRGTFVGSERNGAAALSYAASARSPADYIEARLRFEPELAWMIVANATAADFDLVRDALRRGESATSAAEFEVCDSDFHAALVNATHNSLAIDMYHVIDEVRRREHAKWAHLHGEQSAEQRKLFLKEHSEIFNSLVARDARGAREVWSNHIRQTKRRILDI